MNFIKMLFRLFRKLYRSRIGFFLLLVVLLLPLFFFQIRSNDFWTALYSGRYLSWFNAIAHHSTYTFVPVKDTPGFFENPAFGAVHWETFNWLSYITFYNIFQLGGIPTLQVMRLLIGFLSIYFLHSLINFRTNQYVLLLFFLYGHGIYLRMSMRTYLFTVIFIPLIFLIWQNIRYYHDQRWNYLLPVVLVIWSNMHASYLIGFGIVILILLGDLIDSYRYNLDPIGTHTRAWLSLAWAAVLVVWVKPLPDYMWLNYSGKVYSAVKNVLSSGIAGVSMGSLTGGFFSQSLEQIYWTVISLHRNFLIPDRETAVSGYSHPIGYLNLRYVQVSLAIGVISIILLILYSNKYRFSNLIPAFVIVVAASGRLRTLAYIPLVLIPIFLIKVDNDELDFSGKWSKSKNMLCSAILIVFLISSSFYAISGDYHKFINIYQHRVDWGVWRKYSDTMPKNILRNHPNERFFNNFGIGSFLIWNWWPYKKVYFEPKWAPYYSDFIENRLAKMEEYDLKYAIVSLNVRYLNNMFLRSPEWKILYKDPVMITYQKFSHPAPPARKKGPVQR